MKESRLIELLKNFSGEDMKSFGRFLNSPFAVSRRKISVLFDYLFEYHPDFNSSDLEKETVFDRIFPEKQFNQKQLNNYIADLTKAIEDYLMHTAVMSEEADALIYASKGFYNKKLFDQAIKVINRIEKKLLPGFSSSKNYFSIMRKIYYLKTVYYSDVDFEKLKEAEKTLFEISAMQFLVDYTWMKCESETGSGTLLTKQSHDMTEIIADSFDVRKLLENIDKFHPKLAPMSALHYAILKTIEEPKSIKNYKYLKEIFTKNIEDYDREERFMILGHLINWCGNNIRLHNMDLDKEMFDNYKKLFQYDAYSKSVKEYLMVIDYRNAMLLAILENDMLFLEKLFKEYSAYLDPELKSDSAKMAESNFYYLKNDFKKVIEVLAGIRNENFVFKLDLRMLRLKTYYELGYIEEAYSQIDSYKHYITNNDDISEFTRGTSRTFIKAINLLLKNKTDYSENSFFSLIKEIDKLRKYQFKDWFLSKAEELKKNWKSNQISV